jgi:predicted ATPase
MALPDAEIFSFDDGAPRAVAYDDVEHVQLLKSFLQEPRRFLRHFTTPSED